MISSTSLNSSSSTVTKNKNIKPKERQQGSLKCDVKILLPITEQVNPISIDDWNSIALMYKQESKENDLREGIYKTRK